MKLTLGCWEQYLTSLGDNIKLNHNSLDPSLIFLNSYINAECPLQDTTGEQSKNFWLSYCYGHLVMAQNRLVTQQLPTLNNYVMRQGATPMTFQIWCRTVMIDIIDSWMLELTQPNNNRKHFLKIESSDSDIFLIKYYAADTKNMQLIQRNEKDTQVWILK